ncbi:Sulfofructose kinase [Roseobacter fucihabitans]|uniref:Sulfofructose kinase n=1 Tax=Roseobacter fucihabitans TaxID=1537242 RepID=A0ABZ2BR30_9RHOB|nr:PfkB family carbohydrate kinase [Roseobacter litoralis]MBC6965423.1 putative sugar kinase YdjH [Roseobacter litoralis]
MARVLCAGLIAADLVFDMPSFPVEGDKHRARASHLIGGGGALNAACAIAALGGEVSLAGAVGADVFGIFLRQKMHDRGIDDTLVRDVPGVTTSRSTILLSAGGERTIINHREAALMQGDVEVPETFSHDAMLVDTRWPQGVVKIAQMARRAGKPVVVDGEAPVKLAMQVLKTASHIVFSQQGLKDFAGSYDADALQSVATDLGVWCAVTRGALPTVCCVGEGIMEIPVPAVEAKNTLGAGDAWHGAFTLALAKGYAELQAVRWANAAASHKVRFAIETETFASTAQTDALMAQMRD